MRKQKIILKWKNKKKVSVYKITLTVR